ncbi:MAG: hypothetical protein RLZZ444_2026 [Pseudomonadota bacterium]|jgi:hypothetical protein
MSALATTHNQVVKNIERFKFELDKSEELQRRLSFARSWYAHKSEDGAWSFAPSKFCGYKNMSADEYVNDDPRDGRRTERQLQAWFTQVPESEELFEELSEELAAFLGKYDRPPSAAFRINVSSDFYLNRGGEGVKTDRMLADLIIAVALRLPPIERSRVRNAL